MMFVPHRKYTYGPPRPVMGIALYFYCLLKEYVRMVLMRIVGPERL
jgi:hypothetical protein